MYPKVRLTTDYETLDILYGPLGGTSPEPRCIPIAMACANNLSFLLQSELVLKVHPKDFKLRFKMSIFWAGAYVFEMWWDVGDSRPWVHEDSRDPDMAMSEEVFLRLASDRIEDLVKRRRLKSRVELKLLRGQIRDCESDLRTVEAAAARVQEAYERAT